MGVWRHIVLVLFTAIAVKFIPSFFTSQLPLHFGGHCNAQFKKVEDSFKKNFEKGWEHEGAAFAVYHKGKLMVDLWGGYADESAMRPWKEDTMTMVFSATKAVAAVCVARLVDSDLVNYDDLVTKHWPEFGQNGKANVTVSMLMNHEAGLAALDDEITVDYIKDHRKMSELFEKQKPFWPPGTKRGYHGLTFGWLVDQLIRRVDKQKRSVGQFFNEEIAKPNGIDFYIGLPPELEYRVARLSSEGFSGVIGQFVDDPAFIRIFYTIMKSTMDSSSLIKKVMDNVQWMNFKGRFLLNNPEIHQLEMPAANGIGTARGLAKTLSLIAEGSLLNEKVLQFIKNPLTINQQDAVLLLNSSAGHGFLYSHPPNDNNNWIFGHPGSGGSYVKVDLKNRLSFAYVTNGLKPGMLDTVRTWDKLQKALYNSL